MRKELKIKTRDKKVIYGTLDTPNKSKGKLVIFVHGFLGEQDGRLCFNGAKYFINKGFDTFRFDLYSGEKNARHFRDVKLSIHGEDLNTVIHHFKETYKNIYLIGHSYGGTTLLFADSSLVKAMVFWDASYVDKRHGKMPYNKKLGVFIMDWGFEVIMGKGFVEELRNFPDCGKLVENIQTPVKFITAGKEGNEKAGKKYFAKANEPKILVNIPTATHGFTGFKEEDNLFTETYNWLKRF